MKKSILLVVVLLCMASLMAAMAYSSAQVTNPATMSIVNSNDSLLGMYPWNDRVGTKDKTVFIDEDGVMKFNFAAGYGGDKGFQPGSVYKWGSLFRVYNRSNDTIEVTIDNNGLQYISVAQIGYIDHASNSKFVYVKDGVNTGHKFKLKPGDQWTISVKFDIPMNAPRTNIAGSLVVSAEAVAN